MEVKSLLTHYKDILYYTILLLTHSLTQDYRFLNHCRPQPIRLVSLTESSWIADFWCWTDHNHYEPESRFLVLTGAHGFRCWPKGLAASGDENVLGKEDLKFNCQQILRKVSYIRKTKFSQFSGERLVSFAAVFWDVTQRSPKKRLRGRLGKELIKSSYIWFSLSRNGKINRETLDR